MQPQRPSGVSGDIPGDIPDLGLRGEYQRADTTLTLREGLAEYYVVNPGLSNPAHIQDPKSARYFRNHDCTHVVFGTHTGPLDEGVNDLLTMWGVDIRFRDYIAGFLATDESKSIAQSYAKSSVFRLFWRTMKLTPKIRRVARAMHKKWPWNPAEADLDRPLTELRSEFGIELMRPEVELGLVDDGAGR